MIFDSPTTIHITLALASTLISFFVVALLIEFFLFAFQVRQARSRVICRSLALLKLPFDFALFINADPSFLKHLNPLGCERYFYKLIAQYVPAFLLEFAVLSLLVTAFLLTVRKCIQLYIANKALKAICRNAASCQRKVLSHSLQKSVQEQKVRIVQTDAIDVPCAFGRDYIIFPSSLVQQLSDAEYEAVLAHELEHIQKYDPYLKTCSILLAQLFLWIPTKWWIHKLEEEQELACDAQLQLHGIDHVALAQAIYRVLCKRKAWHQVAVSCFTATKQGSLYRIRMILENGHVLHQSRLRLAVTVVSCATSLYFGTIWLC